MKPIPRVLSLAFAAALLASPALAADTKTSKAAPDTAPKTHVLFMGLDLDWQQGKEFHRVQGVRGRSAVVSVGKREQTVAMGRDNNTFKVVNSLKLGKPAVRVDQVKLDRFYTAGNDPQRRFMEAFSLSTAAMDETMVAQQLALKDQHLLVSVQSDGPEADPDYPWRLQGEREAQLNSAMVNITALSSFTQTRVMPTINPTPPMLPAPKSGSVALGDLKIEETDVAVPAKSGSPEAPKAQSSAGSAEGTASTSTPLARSDAPAAATSGTAAVEAKLARTAAAKPAVITDTSGEWCDAFELKFEVSSEKILADPYVVVVLTYIDPQDPAKPRQWVHAQQLEPIGPNPRQIRLRHAGFPPGFSPKPPSIHIYDRGRELATSAAGGMALTQDEAMEYLVVEYVSTNKKATLAAAPIAASFPEDLAARLQAAKFPKEVYVSVNAGGMAVEMFADAGRRRRVEDPAVRATITEMRFYPALEKGKAIDGVARLAFNVAVPSAGRPDSQPAPPN